VTKSAFYVTRPDGSRAHIRIPKIVPKRLRRRCSLKQWQIIHGIREYTCAKYGTPRYDIIVKFVFDDLGYLRTPEEMDLYLLKLIKERLAQLGDCFCVPQTRLGSH